MNSRIAMDNEESKNNKCLFTSKLDINLRKRTVKCYFWSAAVYGAETWTLRAMIRNTWKSIKRSFGEGRRRSSDPIMYEMKYSIEFLLGDKYRTYNKGKGF